MLLVEEEFGATWLHLGELCGRAYLQPAPLRILQRRLTEGRAMTLTLENGQCWAQLIRNALRTAGILCSLSLGYWGKCFSVPTFGRTTWIEMNFPMTFRVRSPTLRLSTVNTNVELAGQPLGTEGGSVPLAAQEEDKALPGVLPRLACRFSRSSAGRGSGNLVVQLKPE